jgi:hypothetical protein
MGDFEASNTAVFMNSIEIIVEITVKITASVK